ncbi:porin family protein [Sphingobacterium bovistauri]|uniref:PorT family protein n=1 Tax=Sphingobacterium bovistauri TaxID=2781959 RepID=A0ABS7Z128_9SPHI|nr:porin family protein [Sphingobacterium bovistauri]MCA5003874.1 PorT family protein [Sphingobacterium bovistauri]
MINFTKTTLKTLATLATLFFTFQANAQDYYTQSNSNNYGEEKNFRLGLSINPNIGWLRYDDDYDASSKVGFSYGLIADLGFAKNYYFSTGLLVNSISSKVDFPASGIDKSGIDRESIRLQYVDIPLTIKLKSEENETGRFYGQFGFTAGFKVSGKEKLAGASKKTAIDGDDIFRLGLQLGGGKEWKLSDNLGLMTGLTFNNGFTRAIKEGKPKSSFVALNLGIFF